MSHPNEPRNIFDRAIEAAFPGWAARRAMARGALASYRGAIQTRSATRWDPSTSYRGGRQADRRDQGSMRDRARGVDLNNVVGQGLLDTETDNVVAEGLSLQMKSSSPAFNAEAVDRFYRWLDTRADVMGQMTASDHFRESWRGPRRDGDGGIVLATRGGYPYLQHIPGDLIANPWGRGVSRDGFDWRNTFDGVECDPAGRPLRFWVRDVDERGTDAFTGIDARDFVYLCHRRNPLAARGTTVFAPIFPHLDQFDSLLDSVTKTAIMACIFGLIHKTKNPAAALSALGTAANAAGDFQKAVTLDRGGMLKVVGAEDSVTQVQAMQPLPQMPDFLRALLRIICLAFGMPLEIGMRDLSQVNFSGGRIGLISYYRGCRVKQDWLKSRCWNRIAFWWLSVEKRRQELGYDDAFATPFPADYGTFEFHGQEWAFTDPLTEAQADLLEVSMGTNSLQRVCEARGRDFDQIQSEIEAARNLRADKHIPNVLSNVTRDESQKVTAVDADGNPVAGQGAPLNGVQITSALQVLAQVGERTLIPDAAAILLAKLGISETDAKQIVGYAAKVEGVTPGDRDFNRQFLLKLMDVPGARQVLYNITNIPDVAESSGLQLDPKVLTNPDQGVPFLPVVSEGGPLVSGATITDPQGDLVGGDVENEAPPDAPTGSGGTRNAAGSADAAEEPGQGQQEQKGQQQPPAGGGDKTEPSGAGGGAA